MGTNNYGTKSPGDVISSADPNQYKTGLTNEVVPRNTSGIPTDIGGNLGSTLYRWLTGYFKKLIIGTAADDFSIEGSASTIWMKLSSVTKFKVDTNGVDGTHMKALSIDIASIGTSARPRWVEYSTAGTFSYTVPSYCLEAGVLYAGGGGGGGGGGSQNGDTAGCGGGGGGSGSIPKYSVLQVTPGEVLTIVVGAGGSAGARGTNNGGLGSNGGNGGNGGDTSVSGLARSVRTNGGNGGSGGIGKNADGTAPRDGGAGGGGGWTSRTERAAGGGGGQGLTGGSGHGSAGSGEDTVWGSGGAGGPNYNPSQSSFGTGGGGGGGGAGVLAVDGGGQQAEGAGAAGGAGYVALFLVG